MTKDGKPIHFTLTTRKDTVAKETTPAAYYYINGTMTAAWDTSEFMRIEEWLEGQESATEAKAVAKKRHAADHPSREKATEAEEGHVANQPQVQEQPREKGQKGTQGSGISMQKMSSTPGPAPAARRAEPAMKKAPRSSVDQTPVADSDTDSPVKSEEPVASDTITSRVRYYRPDPNGDAVRRQKEQRKRETTKMEDKKDFEGLERRYKRQAAENEMQWMTRMWETEREQVVTLATRWVDQVATVRVPSGAQRNTQVQSFNTALAEFQERRRLLYKLQGAIRCPHWLPAGRTGHMPDFPVANHSPRHEGALHPSRLSRHSFAVAMDWEGQKTWILHLLHLQPAQVLALTFQRAGFILHSVQEPWLERVPLKQNCSYLAVKAASAFVYKPMDGDIFNKVKSITEPRRDERRSTLEWLQGWRQIKVQPQSKRRGNCVVKCPRSSTMRRPPG